MRILFLCKRRPQGKDLLSRPYGRFYHLPFLLSQRAHEVHILLLSYRWEPAVEIIKESVIWKSQSLISIRPPGYIGQVKRVIRKINPHWIVGFSDTYFGILAQWLANKHGSRSAIDAYDNYESYIPWLKPLHLIWRRAIKDADVVTAAGPHLAQYLKRFRPHKKVHIVPMAADPTGFRPLDKQGCRKKLNLPQDKKLIGYCGSISHDRGIQTVFSAYEQVHRANSNTLLLLSGRLQKNLNLPANTRYLGYLSDDLVPILLNCMDVLLVPNQLTKFGNFSYSVKLYEAMSCQIPVVATATEPAKWILKNEVQFLARPADINDMAQKIKSALQIERPVYKELNTWENSCDRFEEVLLTYT